MQNIETQLVQWLSRQPELEGCPVSLDAPERRPERFITIERVGGAETRFIDTPTLAVQCWAGSRVKAAQLADLTKSVLERAWAMPNVARIDVQSTINFPLDESTPRYQITVDLTVHKYEAAG
ncbi:hypothetical protein JS533_005225 [Bifidobacterium amazonense]|uniref:Phage protein n=1 Tax=Bifidobacterium amazonense TaxID=2809027 RepID=A0ABS9VV38_9BIFI|nr:hypothetical protein [Bifidobacterium amazonense]MCH9275675.1 hypothetical protein [Bifidobacterium amazonense]